MKSRVLVLGLALWLGVVAAGSGATWLVIDRVGRDVVRGQQESRSSTAGSTVTETVPTASPSASNPPRHKRPPRATQRTETPPPPATPRSSATTEPPDGATSTPREKTPRAEATRSPVAKAPSSVTRTWTGPAGRVTVRCTGARAGLVSASPTDGWRVEAGTRGPEEVEVEFKSSSEASDVHVKSRCSGGQPRFAVENDD